MTPWASFEAVIRTEEQLLYRGRLLGLLFIAGGVGDVLVISLPHWPGVRIAVCVGVAIGAFLVGGMLELLGDRLTARAHPWIVAFGTVLISVAVYGVGPQGAGTALVFYPLVGLYVGGMFGRRLVVSELVFLGAAFACPLAYQQKDQGLAEWAAAVLVTSVVSTVVHGITRGHRRLALHDPLTGLPNRRALEESTRILLAAAARRGFPLSIAVLDLDHFKETNADRGHQGADSLLCEISRRWRLRLRAEDLLARYGGDEFVLLLPDTDPVTAVQVVERLVLDDVDGAGFSAGVATWDGTESQADLLERADRSLFRAKREGGGRVVAESDGPQRGGGG